MQEGGSYDGVGNKILGTSWASGAGRSWVLEEVGEKILSAAITDSNVLYGTDILPKRYYQITHTSNRTELNTIKFMSTGGATSLVGRKIFSSFYLYVKTEPKWERAVQCLCEMALMVIFLDRDEFYQGFCVVRRHIPMIKMSLYKRGKSVKKIQKRKKNKEGGISERSACAFLENLNCGTTGERVYLCY